MWDGDLVQRLERVVELVGADLEAPGVGGDRGDLATVQPAGRGERQAGGGPSGVLAPAVAAYPRELPDGFAITPEHLDATITAQGESARVGRGDLLVVRTGRLTRARRNIAEGRGWGDYAGGDSPGLSFATADWLHGTEIAGVATDTWGFEVRPNEFDVAFQPLHQVAIPNIGLFIGEMWDLDALAADCAADGRYDFWLTAAPLPVTGAVGAPVNPIAVK